MDNAGNMVENFVEELMSEGAFTIASAESIRSLPGIGGSIPPGAQCGFGGGSVGNNCFAMFGLDGDSGFVFMASPQRFKETFWQMLQRCDEMIAAQASEGEVASNG